MTRARKGFLIYDTKKKQVINLKKKTTKTLYIIRIKHFCSTKDMIKRILLKA